MRTSSSPFVTGSKSPKNAIPSSFAKASGADEESASKIDPLAVKGSRRSRVELHSLHDFGASIAVMLEGKLVVDLWDGFMDKGKTRPWTESTIANVFSVTKGWTAICAHRLVDQGKLDLDRPVAAYLPEFAQGDKSELPVRALLDHRAGLPAIRALLAPEALFDWPTMTAALAIDAVYASL